MGKKDRSIKRIIKKRIHIINNQEKIIKNDQSGEPKKKFLVQTPIEPKKMVSTPTIKIDSKTVNLKPNNTVQLKAALQSNERFAARTGVEDTRHLDTKVEIPEILKGQYRKKQVVDFDLIIIISSFDRYNKVKRILDQIYLDECNYTFKVILLNDGSTDSRYDNIESEYSNVTTLKNEINGGKIKYWESITKLFQETKKYTAHCILQIDDDYLLCDQFINKIMDTFFYSKESSNRYVGISFHRTHEDVPEQWGLKHWVDGGTLYDYNFIKLINFTIDRIGELRWEKDGELSSGVWHQVSKKINRFSGFVHKTESSLAYHDGNYDSKMNKTQRDRSQIITWNFTKKHE